MSDRRCGGVGEDRLPVAPRFGRHGFHDRRRQPRGRLLPPDRQIDPDDVGALLDLAADERTGEMRNHPPLVDRVDRLVAALTAAHASARRALIRARLEKLGPGGARCLAGHLGHPDCLTRWEIANLLGELAEPSTLEPLVRFALNEDEVHARWRSFWAVSRFAPRTTVPLLAKALRARNRTHRWRAALMLSMLDRPEAGPVLVAGLRSPDRWIQWEALNAIRSLGLAGAEDAVGRFLAPESPRDHRQEAVLALGAIGSSKALARVRRALTDADPQIRWRASMSLAGSGQRRWCDDLRARLQHETDPEVISQLTDDIDYLDRPRRPRPPSRSP